MIFIHFSSNQRFILIYWTDVWTEHWMDLPLLQCSTMLLMRLLLGDLRWRNVVFFQKFSCFVEFFPCWGWTNVIMIFKGWVLLVSLTFKFAKAFLSFVFTRFLNLLMLSFVNLWQLYLINKTWFKTVKLFDIFWRSLLLVGRLGNRKLLVSVFFLVEIGELLLLLRFFGGADERLRIILATWGRRAHFSGKESLFWEIQIACWRKVWYCLNFLLGLVMVHIRLLFWANKRVGVSLLVQI